MHCVKWRRQYDGTPDPETSVTVGFEPSLTQQSFTSDCDVNVLAQRFGIADDPVPVVPIAGEQDFTGVPDFHEIMDRVHRAKAHFMELPVELRSRFRNSIGEMYSFVNDPRNKEEAVRLGLLFKAEVPEPVPDPMAPVIKAIEALAPKEK